MDCLGSRIYRTLSTSHASLAFSVSICRFRHLSAPSQYIYFYESLYVGTFTAEIFRQHLLLVTSGQNNRCLEWRSKAKASSSCLAPSHEAYGALVSGEWSASRSCFFTPRSQSRRANISSSFGMTLLRARTHKEHRFPQFLSSCVHYF